jgi:hypothetical protein
MSDCLRVAERLDGFVQPNETLGTRLRAEHSGVCNVLVNSEVETQREGNRSDETKLHEIHGRSEFFSKLSRQVS